MTVLQLKRIAIALLVALFLWGVAEIIGGRGDVMKEDAVVGAIDPARIDSVVLLRATDTVVLARTGADAWSVNGFAASPDAVGELIALFEKPLAGELAAQSPSSHARMGVADSGDRRIRVVGGGQTLAEVLVGTQGRAFGTVFVRRWADEHVYLVSGPLASLVGRAVTDWRDKRIVRLEPDSVAQLAIRRGRTSFGLRRQGASWTFVDGGLVDSSAVARLLGEFRSLEAQGTAFATPEEEQRADFTRPDRLVTLLGGGGDTLAALLFDSTDSGFWVRHAGGGTVYRVYQWLADQIVPADSVLRKKG